VLFRSHAFMMVWRHTVESLLMAEVRWAVYWVTCVCRGIGCQNCLLEVLETVRFGVRSPYALFKFSFGDCCAFGIDFTPIGGEGCDHRGHHAIVRIHGVRKVAEGGRVGLGVCMGW